MTLEQYYYIGELSASGAVLVSLAYLAIQIRQNTRQMEEHTNAVRAAALHASLSYALESRTSVATSEDLALIYGRGMDDPQSLDEIERLRFRLTMANIVDTFFDMFSQTKMSGFSPETWKSQANSAQRVIGSKGGRWFWSTYGAEYDETFRREVDVLLGEAP